VHEKFAASSVLPCPLYQSRVAERDTPVLAAMRTLAGQYPRFGYRKIQVYLARQGHVMSAERMYRLNDLHRDAVNSESELLGRVVPATPMNY
jgi:hypothetical protein